MSRSLRFQDVSVGDELPQLDVPLTAAIITGGALASRDFTPVHHDKSVARAQGLPDVIMNILTTNGYVGRLRHRLGRRRRHDPGRVGQAGRAEHPRRHHGDDGQGGLHRRRGRRGRSASARTAGATTWRGTVKVALPTGA